MHALPPAPPTHDADGTTLAAYYARRAASYEAIYAKPERQADLRALEAALPTLFANRRVLEVACGTGWWTLHGARAAAAWLATDLNPDTLAIARSKLLPACVQVAIADANALHTVAPGQVFDAAFAGHWWSHVLQQQLPAWLAALHARLQPGARVVFLDNVFVAGSSTPIARTDTAGNTYQQRLLPDGTQHEVLKNFPTAEQAIGLLGPRALRPQWQRFGHYWLLQYTLA